jgi:ABC-type phosphate transport system substrate-binding protein
MRGLRTLLLLLALLLPAAAACAEIVVVVNAQNPVTALTRNQVIDLYMGRQINFPGGAPALPLDQAAGSNVRGEFYRALTGKSEANINAYWARLLFTGIASPPRAVPTADATLRIVRENASAIAYVESADVEKDVQDKRVKIVLRFDAETTAP